jgi:hypothetical protein
LWKPNALPRPTPSAVRANLAYAALRLHYLKKLAAEQAGSPPASVLAWAERYRRIDDRPFSLERFAPLAALYADPHPHLVVLKPAQRGVSEFAINLAAYALDCGAAAWAPAKNGLNVAYIFPTQGALGDFSKERFGGLKTEHPYLAGLFGGDSFDAVTFKQVRSSYLFLRGGWSVHALLSFSADVLILDEFDRMDSTAIALAVRRMAASDVRRRLDISTPTLPGRGIDGQYLQSDQRVYEQPCPACGEWITYDFFRDVHVAGVSYRDWQRYDADRIRRSSVALVCPACHADLDAAGRCAPGRWVATVPDVTTIHGYKLPPLAYPMVDLTAYAVSAVSPDPSEQQEFYRSDLGIPYEAGGSRVTAAMLSALSHDLPGGRLPEDRWTVTTMGVDVGARFHYRISALGADRVRTVLAMGSVTSWDELDGLMARYRIRSCVIDALPELHACKTWADKYAGRVLRAFYPTARALAGKLFHVQEPGEGSSDGRIVQINRTMALDRVYGVIAGAAERWPASIHNDPEVVAHLTAPIRVTHVGDDGQEQVTWEHIGPDHLSHATVYDLVAGVTLPSVTPGILLQGTAKIPARGARR